MTKENKFKQFDLPEQLIQSLSNIGFSEPTEIQERAIPVALEGKDILGSAQTGTGKTGAFSIPLIAKLLTSENSCALVITPTRELASQVMKSIESILGKKSNIKSALLIGGESITKQLFQLKKSPRIFVGTPGRINDHLKRRSLNLKRTEYLVLDETDRMLDMGFSIQINDIAKYLPEKRQTLLFSATLPNSILKIANTYLSNPERISVGSTTAPAKNIKHETLNVNDVDKYDQLISQLEKRAGSIIIFVKTKFSTEKIAKRLNADGYKASAIHGDLQHRKRERVIKDFRNCKCDILVATDIASRGLDIPHIQHVINFDLPQCPEDYIHRIGRTARAGAEGEAICFISPSEKRKWAAIARLIDPDSEAAKFKEPRGKKGAKRNSSGKKKSGFFGKNKKPRNNNSKFAGKPNSSKTRTRSSKNVKKIA